MSAEFQLEVIRKLMAELLPSLEEFIQVNYIPGSDQTREFKQKLLKLLDEITVYEHYISRMEISSSFDIHAAISSKIQDEKDKSIEHVTKEEKKLSAQTSSQLSENPEVPKKQDTNERSGLPGPEPKPIPLSINDRFLILKKLFKNSQIEWNSAWQQFSLCQSKVEILDYLKSLRELYQWEEKDETYQLLERACLKKFSS